MNDNLKDKVREIVEKFINNSEVFTALDVCNKMKEEIPFARYGEVRGFVRDLFPLMQATSYSRTPISVTLRDGSTSEAFLYHHVSDTWDLDTKYDASKRDSRVTAKVSNATVTVTQNGVTIDSKDPVVVFATKDVNITSDNVVITADDNKKRWMSLFTGARLFPPSKV